MRSVPIQLKRLDDVISAHEHIDFIKMDIEGAEVLALRGMRALLARDKPTIMMEYWPRRFKKLNTTSAELFEILGAAGYTCWDIEENTGVLRPSTVEEIKARYPESRDGGTNLLCTASSSG